jgi:hypothetical protein
MTARTGRWPVAMPRKPVKSRRDPAPGTSFLEQFGAPGRADVSESQFWKMKSKRGVK